jgi:hypothetical protein
VSPEDALAWAVTGLVVIIAACIVIPILVELGILIVRVAGLIIAGMILLVGFGLYLIRDYLFRPSVNFWKWVLGS